MSKKPDDEEPQASCSAVMAAMVTQHEDQATVCALVAKSMQMKGALAVALDDVSALNGDVVAELLRSPKC